MKTAKSQHGSALAIVMVVVVIAILGGIGYMWYANQPKTNGTETAKGPVASKSPSSASKISAEATAYTSDKGVKILLNSPQKNQLVKSPVTVTGQVPGNWSFEGVFMLGLLDASEVIIANGQAKLDGNWQTKELVTFAVTLEYDKAPATNRGFLLLMKSNPSGLAENNDQLKIPVKFSE